MSDLNRQQFCAESSSQRTELYRHFDKRGQLLYVGVSLSTAHRLGQHRIGSKWADRIATITIERFPTRAAALAAELQAIQSEQPRYNKLGSVRQPKFRVTINLSRLTTDPLPPAESPLERYFRLRNYKLPVKL